MSNLKAGFARIDITPPLGTLLWGYPNRRPADGILDNLTASAVVFDDGEKKAVIISTDLGGISLGVTDEARALIAEAVGTPKEAVFLHCTHTHLGPTVEKAGCHDFANPEYVEWFFKKIQDVAVLAVQDLAPAKLSCARGEAKEVAYVRTYLMKDGSYMTNPKVADFENIVRPVSYPDDTVQLLIVKRENAPEIGIVNFQVHPDVIGGSTMSADYPHFVRDTYESIVKNSRCMYINGCQGDTNSGGSLRPYEKTKVQKYGRSRHMGRKIAMAALANYELAEPLEDEKIAFAAKTVAVKFNKGRPDQIEDSLRVVQMVKEYEAQGMITREARAAASPSKNGMTSIDNVVEAYRIVRLMDRPDEDNVTITAIRVGDVVFAGIPGEPFTDIGRSMKENSKFKLTIPACCTNGYQGYFPMKACFERAGYERSQANFACGAAEKIIEASTELINAL